MEQDLPNNNLLEDYLLGKLSAAEQAQLEQQLVHDPQFREELEVQQDIVEGLKEARHLELKARLNSIPVNTGWVLSPLAKIAAGISLVAASAFSLYMLIQDSPSSNLVSGLTLEDNFSPLTSPIQPEPSRQTGILPQAEEEISAASIPQTDITESPKRSELAKPSQLPTSDPKPATVGSYSITKPEVLSNFDDRDIGSATLDDKPSTDVFSSKAGVNPQPLEVNTQPKGEYQFHYQFSNGRLYIYGDFASQPYEVLEINRNGKTQYFLYYEENFYGLKQTQHRVAPLRKITNPQLIEELRITRGSK